MSEALFERFQTILAGFDTALSQRWREEDRQFRDEDRFWRREDLDWRKKEETKMNQDYAFMEAGKRWRGEDIEQRVLDNARHMWNRSVENNRRAVEERAEQLKEVSNISALIAGFALIAFLEFSFDVNDTRKELVYGFGLTTALTVGLMVNSMVTCSFMHASILKTGRKYVSEKDEADFMFNCRDFARQYNVERKPPPLPSRSFEQHWDHRCEGEWRRAFYCFATGIPMFMLNLALAGLIKFHEVNELGIVIAVLVGAAFLAYLRSCFVWASHLIRREPDMYRESFSAGSVGLPFDWHLPPATFHTQRPSIDGISNSLRQIDPEIESASEEAESENADDVASLQRVEPSRVSRSRFLQRQTQSLNLSGMLRQSPHFSSFRKDTEYPLTTQQWQESATQWIPSWISDRISKWTTKTESSQRSHSGV